MPKGILNHNYKSNQRKQDDAFKTTSKKQSLTNGISNCNATLQRQQQQQQQLHLQQEKHQSQQTQNNSILNVAEMLLHGVADHEILDIWLGSIACQEYARNFVDAGYDMPTISRITPQDLTAIGITDPTKRLKILGEIKKLNLQDGLPKFKPASLSHWLSLLRLDSYYLKSLCDQHIDTIEKTCQLTWEDFEELGITKLGHQKRLQLAIERMREIESQEAKNLSKPMSEPIYDTNPSQILLVASAENHSMNGPIINKQSSTSELSSTGSGSMHSLYSANSTQYQPSNVMLSTTQQQLDSGQRQQQQHQQQNQSPQTQDQKQAIYGQLPSQLIKPTQQLIQTPTHQQPQQSHLTRQPQTNSHYQSVQQMANQSQFFNSIYDSTNLIGRNLIVPSNRQSLGQLPFALTNLPKHQQQLLQQSSIYATLSRQPQRAKQPPPPVPIRTNSLKSNSLTDDESSGHRIPINYTNTATNLCKPNTRIGNKNQFNSHTLLSKNKSFSGNAYMEAARSRFLNRNSQNPPQVFKLPQQMQPPIVYNVNSTNSNQNVTKNTIYGSPVCNSGSINGHRSLDSDNSNLFNRQSINTPLTTNQVGTQKLHSIRTITNPTALFNQITASKSALTHQSNGFPAMHQNHGDDPDIYSDTNSTKSLIMPPSAVSSSPVNNNRQSSLSQDSDSSQTLYNSASSGSTDRNLSVGGIAQPNNTNSCPSTISNLTLNDVSLIQDNQHRLNHLDLHGNEITTNGRCNATTGRDEDFPPPPSPLALNESDEHEVHPMNPESNFNDLSQRLMTFRVGI